VNIRFDNVVVSGAVGHSMDDTCALPATYKRMSTKQMDRNRMRATSWSTHTTEVKKRKMDDISPEINRKDTDVTYTENVDTPERVCVDYGNTTPLRRSSTMTPDSLIHHVSPAGHPLSLSILEDFANPTADTAVQLLPSQSMPVNISKLDISTQVEYHQKNKSIQCAVKLKSKSEQTGLMRTSDESIQVGADLVVCTDSSVQHQAPCADKFVQVPGIDQTYAAIPAAPTQVESVDIAKHEVDDITESHVPGEMRCPCCESNMSTNHTCENNTDTDSTVSEDEYEPEHWAWDHW